MKAILKFDLPDEQSAFNDAINGGDYQCALSDIFNDMRSVIKYDAGYGGKYLGELVEHFLVFLADEDNPQSKAFSEEQRKAIGEELQRYLNACGDVVALYEYRDHLFKNVISGKVKETL